MTVFESLNNTSEKATEKAQNYVKTSQEYIRLKIFQQLTLSLSLVVKLAIIGGLVTLSVIFFAVSIAIAIGKSMNSLPLGYLIVGVILLCFAILAYSLRRFINRKIIVLMSNKFFD